MSLRSVSFRYPDADEDTLHDINLSCRRGQTTAIIGSTGCGKSTVAKLMLRLLDPTQGCVTLHGTDIRRLRQADLRGSRLDGVNLLQPDLHQAKIDLEQAVLIAESLGAVYTP